MSLSNVYTAGLGNVGSYQVSGAPFATGSLSATNAIKVEFPFVTSWIYVKNNDTNRSCKVGFSQLGVENSNYFTVHEDHSNNVDGSSPRLDLKLSELWLSGSSDVDVLAGLTNIPVARINNLSGSGVIVGNNWSGSVGVG